MLSRKPITSSEVLHELFEYKDGSIYHKQTRSGIKAGQRAGNYNIKYPVVKVLGESYKVHRVIFAMHHGECPECLDHINGDTHDNRIENLRPATVNENYANKRIYKNSTSGVKGIYWHKPSAQWVGYIQANKKRIYIGAFETIELAKDCMELVREMLHGKFANHGAYA